MVSFTPLGNPKLRAFQGIVTLDVNNVNVLIDAGWDAQLSPSTLEKLVEMIPSIDLILLTHATLSHAGAFCYLRHKYPQFRVIPAYATLPVVRMSQLMTQEVYSNHGLYGPFDSEEAMSQADVESIWSEVHSVKYSQPMKLHNNPKLEGTTITAYNGGHTLGGSLWKIYDGIDSIVVALDWNHARDAHLNGAFLEPKTGTVISDLQRPSLLITSSDVSSGQTLTKARQGFLESVDRALQLRGTVLIPTSCGSRVLELILILAKHMISEHRNVPLIYCSRWGKQELTQASSMLEWMVSSIIGDWQVKNESPFDNNNIHCVSDLATIRKKWPSGPKVIMAAGECLESGPSKEIFLDLVAEDANSTLILSEICPQNTLGDQILSNAKFTDFSQLNFKLPQVNLNMKEPLTGEALDVFLKARERERDAALQSAAEERRNQQLIDTSAQAEEDSSESENEDEDMHQFNSGANMLLFAEDVYDYHCTEDGGTPIMFPFVPKRRRIDEYGEFIPQGLFEDKEKQLKKALEAAKAKEDGEGEDEQQQQQQGSTEDVNAQEASVEGPGKTLLAPTIAEEPPMTLVKATRKNVSVVCWFARADLNGITNARSLLMMVKQVQPSRIIALPGSEEVCEHLSSQYKDFRVGDEPITFDRTNFSVDVRLDPSIKLEWHNLIGGYSVARVSGNLQFDPHDRIKKAGAVLIGSGPEEAMEVEHKKMTIGDLRLTSLRKILVEQKMKVEFRGQGVLVCNDKVAVQKNADGVYTIQGGIDDDYYCVREAVRKFVTTI